MTEPDIRPLDEPTGGLGPVLVEFAVEQMLDVKLRGATYRCWKGSSQRLPRSAAEHPSSMVARPGNPTTRSLFSRARRSRSGMSVAEDGASLRDAWRGSLYREHTEHHRRHDPAFLSEITLGPGDRLLDIGCGDGAVSASLAARFPDAAVVGIDSAPDMVSTASRRPLPNLSFELCRAQDIAFVDQFTVAISIAALHWVPGSDHPVFLAGLHRALRRAGASSRSSAGSAT